MFTCKQCGGPVTVAEGVIKRNCGHADAGVLASMKAHARGQSSLNSGPAPTLRQRFMGRLDDIMGMLRKKKA